MLTAVIVAGLGLLLVGGVWQLTRVDTGGTGLKRKHLVSENVAVLSRADRRRPERLLEDRAKLRNAAAMTLEIVVAAGTVLFAVVVAARTDLPLALEVVGAGVLLVGLALVGRGVYVRSGLYRPTLERPADYRASLANRLDTDVAREFTSVHDALSDARGDADVDETVACVLAGARAGCSAERLAEWVETIGADDPEQVHDRVERLSEAGIVVEEDGQLRLGEPLADADHAQVATVAESVL